MARASRNFPIRDVILDWYMHLYKMLFIQGTKLQMTLAFLRCVSIQRQCTTKEEFYLVNFDLLLAAGININKALTRTSANIIDKLPSVSVNTQTASLDYRQVIMIYIRYEPPDGYFQSSEQSWLTIPSTALIPPLVRERVGSNPLGKTHSTGRNQILFGGNSLTGKLSFQHVCSRVQHLSLHRAKDETVPVPPPPPFTMEASVHPRCCQGRRSAPCQMRCKHVYPYNMIPFMMKFNSQSESMKKAIDSKKEKKSGTLSITKETKLETLETPQTKPELIFLGLKFLKVPSLIRQIRLQNAIKKNINDLENSGRNDFGKITNLCVDVSDPKVGDDEIISYVLYKNIVVGGVSIPFAIGKNSLPVMDESFLHTNALVECISRKSQMAVEVIPAFYRELEDRKQCDTSTKRSVMSGKCSFFKTFSCVKRTKSEIRAKILDEHLENTLRIATTCVKPYIDALTVVNVNLKARTKKEPSNIDITIVYIIIYLFAEIIVHQNKLKVIEKNPLIISPNKIIKNWKSTFYIYAEVLN
ncbi:hypothetical protein WN51_04284 [Melipona quadrifasciata]|uniref:Uncharacterized protein n=1 Tax=Melipona quadrifasciata TaxID=166423 RepID=A0A0N0BCV2_9HYME|nr:hypothetical protein WN51_04284 [Melipona quadrifasciata]